MPPIHTVFFWQAYRYKYRRTTTSSQAKPPISTNTALAALKGLSLLAQGDI
jgi:hypothetical protein